jgi:hypothetical protein
LKENAFRYGLTKKISAVLYFLVFFDSGKKDEMKNDKLTFIQSGSKKNIIFFRLR